MVLSHPFLLSVAEVLDFDMLWFGVVLMLTIGIAMLLSPFYVNVRIAQLNNRNVSAGRLLSQGAPYAMIMVVALGLLLASPQIALWLPGLVAR
jgi:TRAP-type C4-dicarboxylate transport system permease large subunit